MQHDHVLKKLTFDQMTQTPGLGGVGLQAKYLLSCRCIRDSFIIFTHHDIVLKKLNINFLTPRVGGEGLRSKYLLPCCFIV